MTKPTETEEKQLTDEEIDLLDTIRCAKDAPPDDQPRLQRIAWQKLLKQLRLRPDQQPPEDIRQKFFACMELPPDYEIK